MADSISDVYSESPYKDSDPTKWIAGYNYIGKMKAPRAATLAQKQTMIGFRTQSNKKRHMAQFLDKPPHSRKYKMMCAEETGRSSSGQHSHSLGDLEKEMADSIIDVYSESPYKDSAPTKWIEGYNYIGKMKAPREAPLAHKQTMIGLRTQSNKKRHMAQFLDEPSHSRKYKMMCAEETGRSSSGQHSHSLGDLEKESQASPEPTIKMVAKARVHIQQAKTDMRKIYHSKLFLVGVIKRAFPEVSKEQHVEKCVEELIKMTNAVICEDHTPTGLKLGALLERIVKRSAPRLGFGKIRRPLILDAVKDAMAPHKFEEMPTVDTALIQKTVACAPEVFADDDFKWFAICQRMRVAVNEEDVHLFIKTFYEMVFNVLEELARQKRYGMLGWATRKEKETEKEEEEEEPLSDDVFA